MRLYKATYTNRQGKKEKTKRWYLDFNDLNSRRRRLSLFTDKRAAGAVKTIIADILSFKGLVAIPPELQRRIDNLPTGILKKLSAWGLLDNRIEGSKPITEHIHDWQNSLAACGCTKKHLKAVVPRVEKVTAGCGFKTISDIDVVKAESFLLQLRDKGLSKATYNGYVRALRQFGKWLVDVGRAGRNPFGMLKKTLLTQADQKRPARTLSIDQVRTLIASTAHAPVWQGISGEERSLIYLLCNESGIRANEVRQLQVSDFDFDRATVTIRSAVAKNRKEAVLPIKQATAELIRQHVKDKLPNTTVFTIPAKPHLMIKHDLESAEIPYKTDEGTAHFHAQRHNFATALSVSSASVKTAQNLLRHGDPRLTLGVYTHGVPEHERAAIENLPDLITPPSAEVQKAVKTGTDEIKYFANTLANIVQENFELVKIIHAWPRLSDAVKEAVKALCNPIRKPK